MSYAELDAAILKSVSGGYVTYSYLISKHGRLADSLAKPDHVGERNGWRLIDRRLQALRKRGEITFSRKEGWTIAASQAAEERKS
ncbi:hypothetical protein [Pandoraea apista]|uniref:hypothetical protein n=1 Tax=Pandoraea apista TaxID=93218 RepID=UPI0006590510|nr:hypothetical protein [Pandoraea apista]ALS64917.1 hypothetical protein AT395_07905 [Pandoraea apista]CFB65288.1 hypothetical protein LMG16407_04786 [Pandoraea apista]